MTKIILSTTVEQSSWRLQYMYLPHSLIKEVSLVAVFECLEGYHCTLEIGDNFKPTGASGEVNES